MTETKTGDYVVNSVYVFVDNVGLANDYVFIPSDISKDAWTEVTGDPSSYRVTYGKGAYLEGKPISITFTDTVADSARTTLVRGFYTAIVRHDAYGQEYCVLVQKVDNLDGNCFYTNEVTMHETTVDGTWLFRLDGDDYRALESEVSITDFSGHEIESLADLYYWYENHSVYVAFTVNPATNRVDYIYVVSAGWDAKYTFALSSELKAAGWKILVKDDPTADGALVDSITLTDDKAYEVEGDPYTVKLYNENLKGESTIATKYAMTLTKDGVLVADAIPAAVMTKGVIEAVFTPAEFIHDGANADKTYNYVIGGLSLGDVKVVGASGLDVYKVTGNEDVVLGESVSVIITPVGGGKFLVKTVNGENIYADETFEWNGLVANNADKDVASWTQEVVGTVSESGKFVSFSFYPVHIEGTNNVIGVSFDNK